MSATDIFKLRDMLAAAHVPHEFIDRSHDGLELYQLYYPDAGSWRCSILQGDEIPGEGVELFWRPAPWTPVRECIERHSADDAFKQIYLSYVKWRWHEGKA